MARADALDHSVRQSDLDLWLSSRFIADEAARADVVAIYALVHELARVRTAAREPLIQEIRLAWWRDALDEIASGGPARKHPVLERVAQALHRRGLDKVEIDALVEAAFARLASGASEAFDLATMRLAALVLWPQGSPRERLDAAAAPAARAWTLARSAEPDQSAVLAALEEARPRVKAAPAAVFPAFAHVTLARVYGAGRKPSELGRRLRMTWAVLTGGI